MKLTQVILVDVNDKQTGTMEKMEAHEKGVLHRAFSVFIFNAMGEMHLSTNRHYDIYLRLFVAKAFLPLH